MTLLAGGMAAVVGARNVLVSADEMARYSVDVWRQYRGRALMVVRPGSTEEVARTVALAREARASIVPQGGNTGLVNGGIPDDSGTQVVLSTERLSRIRSVDPIAGHIEAEAGAVLADLQAAARAVGRLFPLSLGAEGSCRIGGNIATNAGGLNVLRYGMTRELVLGLEVVLPDATIWNGLRPLRKDNTGYDLKQFFIGSEGTLGVITAATLRLVSLPRETVTIWLSLGRISDALEIFGLMREEFGELISSFEVVSGAGVEIALRHLDGVRRPVTNPARWHLLVEVAWSFRDGLRERVESVLERVFEIGVCSDGALAESETQRQNMLRLREGQSEAARQIGQIVRADVAVPIGRIPDLLCRFEQIVDGIVGATAIPFGHVGDGNLHLNAVLTDAAPPDAAAEIKAMLFDVVDGLCGSISAEHGVGREKREAILRRKSSVDRRLSASLRHAIDSDGVMNPEVGIG